MAGLAPGKNEVLTLSFSSKNSAITPGYVRQAEKNDGEALDRTTIAPSHELFDNSKTAFFSSRISLSSGSNRKWSIAF